MSTQKRVCLWSSYANTHQTGTTPAATAGGFSNTVEVHGGENNGAAQTRLCPATGKYAGLPGLKWMKDVKSFGTFWSGHSSDPDVGGGLTGTTVAHDFAHAGPYSRLQHVHVLDCEGFDRLKIYWTGVCRAYEGLAIDDTAVTTYGSGILVNNQMADSLCVAAAGMPAVDSRDEMYALPKLMRLNENDSLANEGAAGCFASRPTFTCTVNDTLNIQFGLQNGDIVRAFTTVTLPTGMALTTRYFVVQATSTTVKVSLSIGGAPVAITAGTGSGTHTLEVPAKYPGSGRVRGIPFKAAGVESQVNWEPDLWISGGEPLFTQWKGGKYAAATEHWGIYDQVRPAMSFETNSFNTLQNQGGGPPGMFQWGKVYKDAAGIMKSYKFTQAGDRLESSFWLGYPNRTYQAPSSAVGGLTTFSNNGGPPLSITGLARIALIIGAIKLAWHGNGFTGGTVLAQADRLEPHTVVGPNGDDSTFLVSTPVGPAISPRAHVSGSLWAVLIKD